MNVFLQSTVMWSLVVFGDRAQIVPSIWFNNERSQSKFPPKKEYRNLSAFVESNVPSAAHWNYFPCKIVKQSG